MPDYPKSLLTVMRELGYELHDRGAEWKAICPFHDDHDPSLRINPDKGKTGVYVCDVCGAGGDAVTLLVEKHGFNKAGAMEYVFGPKDEHKATEAKPKAPERPRWYFKRLPPSDDQYDYKDEKGRLMFKVLRRIDAKTGKKTFTQLRKVKMGDDWWKPKADKDGPPTIKKGEIAWAAALPRDKPRPLYQLDSVINAPEGKQIMVVEGEKCVHAVMDTFDKAIVTTWAGGTNSVGKTNFAPLYRKQVLLLADNDAKGREAMQAIAEELHQNGTRGIRIVALGGNTKTDIADIIEKGGKEGAIQWIKKNVRDWQPPSVPNDAPPEAPPPQMGGEDLLEAHDLADNEHYTVLGIMENAVVFKLKNNQFHFVSRNKISSMNELMAIAPSRSWWCHKCATETMRPTDAQNVGGLLMRIADKLGNVDMTRLAGRGANIDYKGRTVWHLGERLRMYGKDIELRDADDDRIYLAGRPIDTGTEDTLLLSEDERDKIRQVLMRYRWNTPEDCKIMLGWMVTSVTGGALPWRPHIWLVGQADQGKTWWATNVINPIHRTMAVQLSDPTGASIARILQSDSLPVIFDEAEPDKEWVSQALDLCRSASGGEAGRSRATSGAHGYTLYHPRFSACFMSTKVPRLSTADNSRIVMVRLSPHGIDDWPRLERDILDIFESPSEMGRRIRHTLVEMTSDIVADFKMFEQDFVRQGNVGTRTARIEAALTAGWKWWGGRDRVRIRHPMMSDANSDGPEMLHEMLSNIVPQEHGGSTSLLECLVAHDINSGMACRAESFGLKKHTDGLLVVPDDPAMTKLMRGTRFSAVSRGPLLSQIPGVRKLKNPRKVGNRRVRATLVPYDVLQALGYEMQARASEGGMTAYDLADEIEAENAQ